jgi:hypothetical protein
MIDEWEIVEEPNGEWEIAEEQSSDKSGNYWLEALGDLGRGFRGGVEHITHGLLQPIAEGGYLGEHVKRGFMPMVEERQGALEESRERSPYATGLGNVAGSIAVRAPAYALTGGSLPAVGALGAAYGAAGLPEGDETRLGNAGREAVTDVALAGLLKGALKTPEFLKSFSGTNNINRIVKDKNAVKAQYNEAYNHLFNEAKEAGGEAIRAPKIKIESFLENSEKKYNKALKDFIKNPTLDGAHKAQSDLGKYVVKMEKSSTPLTSPQIKAVEEALDAQMRLRGSLFTELNKRTGKGLEYQNLTKGYREEVVPFLENKILKNLESNKFTPRTAANKLAQDEAFNLGTNNKYPELQRNLLASNLLKKYLPYSAAGAAGIYGTNQLIDFLKG